MTNLVVNWILRLRNMAFESGVVPKDWSSPVFVPLYKGNVERIDGQNYRNINLLCVAGKIYRYVRILMERVSRVNGRV